MLGTIRDPSLDQKRDKKVSFSKETLEAYKARSQNDRQTNSQLRQLEHNNQYQNNNQQAWQNRPSMNAATACNSL